jgi:hypothetical protein
MAERELLIESVAKEFWLEKDKLISKSRKRELVIIRHCTAEILDNMGFDYKEISSLLNRERTYYYYAIKQSKINREKEKDTQEIFERIGAILRGNYGTSEN